MKILFTIIIVLAFVFDCRAQIKSSAAYDSNVYIPRIGIEIDTIYGSRANQELGGNIWNTGVPANGKYGKVMIGGLQTNPPFLSSIEGGPDFDIKSVRQNAAKLNVKMAKNRYLRYTGHFRDSKHIDALVDTTVDEDYCMYWTDDDGNFDSTRVSLVGIPQRKGYVHGFFAYPPYVGYMTSDSVEDYVFGVGYAPLNPDNGVDTANLFYLALYRGGLSMNPDADTVYPDSLFYLGYQSPHNYREFYREFYRGDFDGDGMTDVVARGGQDLFFYSMKKPFSLASLAESLFYDTLYAQWQNPSVKSFGRFGNNVSPALKHQNKIIPADLLLTYDSYTLESEITPYFYCGGSEFGKKRLFADSADYKINVPRYHDNSFFNMDQGYATMLGDITGTGHKTLYWGGDLGGYSYEFFYVVGKEQDDKADMVYAFEGLGGGSIDTLTANNDQITDIIYGDSRYETPEDYEKNKRYVGTVHIIPGSNKIPVKLGVSKEQINTNAIEVTAYPNPAIDRTSLRFISSYSGNVHVIIRDVLGRPVNETHFFLDEGKVTLPLHLGALPAGTYFIESVMSNAKVLTPITIVH